MLEIAFVNVDANESVAIETSVAAATKTARHIVARALLGAPLPLVHEASRVRLVDEERLVPGALVHVDALIAMLLKAGRTNVETRRLTLIAVAAHLRVFAPVAMVLAVRFRAADTILVAQELIASLAIR